MGVVDRSAQRRLARAALERLGHADLPLETPVRRLSVGMQQVVEIARALVGQSKVIVFDEPTSSLARADVERLFQTIGRLRQEGLGVIYISHFLEEIRRVCDSYLVLRDGKSVASGTLAGTSEAQIVSLMVGRRVDELYPSVPHTPGETLLSVMVFAACQSRKMCRSIFAAARSWAWPDWSARDGPNWSARSSRSTPCAAAACEWAQSIPKPHPRPASARARLCVRRSQTRRTGASPLDRRQHHLQPAASVQPWGWLNLNQRRHAVAEWMEQIGNKVDLPEHAVESLSGGNQQKVALARALHQRADVLLLDEPTRGIDVGTKATIYRLIGELAAAGKAILFVSSYFQELLRVCDRIGVMSRGRLREIRPADEWTEESLLVASHRKRLNDEHEPHQRLDFAGRPVRAAVGIAAGVCLFRRGRRSSSQTAGGFCRCEICRRCSSPRPRSWSPPWE